ncbi:MAG: hypothetical protein C6Y22_19405 [Hapalosiphonaceae cyanobacterium JJU2]|nr:MAG: hypothetical protein C6Y22_19405 [Hapalosiphonaceae cyanobacterium JJU2]
MNKTLISAAIFTLTIAVTVSDAYANPPLQSDKSPHVIGFMEFPQGIRHARILRHTLKLEVPQQSKAVSQLIIEAPSNIIIRDSIDVFDQSGKKVDSKISINGQKATLVFTGQVEPGTTLTIDMNKVKKTAPTNGDKMYKVSAVLVGINAELPVGIAQLRVH